MKYYLIAGEASGDLHAAHLMRALKAQDPAAEFQFCGGEMMASEGGVMIFHYKDLAYMGFVDVALHLRTILQGMRWVKRGIRAWRPDVLILVDYPGFNLKIARFVRKHAICPVFYYIAPKLWAWKEYRIKNLKRDVDHTFCILPFETDFFERKHGYPVTYVGNPTVDEVAAYEAAHSRPVRNGDDVRPLVALLPGSRRSEVEANLTLMLRALATLRRPVRFAVAMAPALPRSFYEEVVSRAGTDPGSVSLLGSSTYALLQRADAALVTSGTATLETALFRVPQVVCYHIRCGRFVNLLRRLFLKVPYISLVNLVVGREVVTELVAGDMRVDLISRHLSEILPGGSRREVMLQDYEEMAARLGKPGAPNVAAREMWRILRNE